MNDLVFVQNESTLTNSLLVAEKFKRNHRDVLESIRNLLTSAENSAVLQMFVETQYVNEQGKELPMFVMNRDGFTLLAMGFNGKKAMKFKLDYIAAFNAMEKIKLYLEKVDLDFILMTAYYFLLVMYVIMK